MHLSSDYENLFKTLNGYKIKYLIVGAYAVIYYTEPRYTKDIDVWVFPDLNDNQKVYDALKKFGAPLSGINPQDFKNKKLIYQIGIAPVRIDIKMDIEGVDFKTAWKNKKKILFGNNFCLSHGSKRSDQSQKENGQTARSIGCSKTA